MRVAVIGIGGRAGSRLAAELLARGHRVTGIERNPKRVEAKDALTIRQDDATQASTLAPLIAGHDAVLRTSRFQTSDAHALIAVV